MTLLQDTKLPENINTFKKIKILLPKALHTDRITIHREICRLKRKPKSLSDKKLNVKLSDLEKQLKTSAQKNYGGKRTDPSRPIAQACRLRTEKTKSSMRFQTIRYLSYPVKQGPERLRRYPNSVLPQEGG